MTPGNPSDLLQRACPRVATRTGARGTAYLVHSRWAVTCEHVVRTVGKGGKVTLFFLPGFVDADRRGPLIERTATVRDIDHQTDCAVLQLDEAYDAIEPLRLARGRAKAGEWISFGYPVYTGENGIPLRGTVELAEGFNRHDQLTVVLYSDTVASGQGAVVTGVSGAPVIVGDLVVGHIMNVSLLWDGKDTELHYLEERLSQVPLSIDEREKTSKAIEHLRSRLVPKRAEFGLLYACPIRFVRRLLERQGQDAPTLQGLNISADDLFSHWNPKARGVEVATLSGSYFTGRTAVLRELVGWLTGNDADRLIRVVTGSPGSGKSTILARLVMQSLRLDNAEEGQEGTVLPPGLIDVAIHARGKDLKQVITQMASDLGIQVDNRELLLFLAQEKRRVVVLLDALNEAMEPDAIADLLAQMVTGTGNVRILVGMRSTGLQRLPPGACVVIDLDDPRYHLSADVADYVNHRLLQEPQSPYRGDSTLARKIAESVADHAGRSFLVAQVVSRILTRQPLGSSPEDWRELITGDLRIAFARDLEHFEDQRHKVRDLLAPLAYAEGRGLPWDSLWAKIATAISGREYSDGDIHWLQQNAGFYIVADLVDDYSVYRLYHQEFARYLQDKHRDRENQKRITDTLLSQVPESPAGTKDWVHASSYIRTHIATHAAAAACLDKLLSDNLYLITAEPTPLLRALTKQKTVGDDEAARTYVMTGHNLQRASLSERASYLELTARRIGANRFADTLKSIAIPRPWTVPWADYTPTKEHHILKGHDGPVRALTTIRLETGPTILSASDDGMIRMWELDSGIEINPPLSGHEGAIKSLVAATVEDRPVAISAGVDETIRVWDLNSRQQSSLPLRGHKGAVNALTIVEMDDSQVVVSGGNDGTVRMWDLRRESSIEMSPHSHRGAIHTLVTGKMEGRPVVVSAGEDSFLRVWDLANHTLLFEFPSVSSDHMSVLDSLFHELNQKVAGIQKVGDYKLTISPVSPTLLISISSLAAIPFGGQLKVVSLSRIGIVSIWDLSTRTYQEGPLCKLSPLDGGCVATGYINSRPAVVLADGSGTLQIWDLMARVAMDTPLIGHVGAAFALTIADYDSRTRIVSGGRDHTVRIWNLGKNDDRNRSTNIDTERIITRVAVETRHDGRQIVASGSSDKQIRIRELATGGQISELTAEEHVPGKVSFAMKIIHDRLILLTLGADQTFSAYDLNDGSYYSLGTLVGLVFWTIAKPDDQFIILAVFDDGKVDVWTWSDKQIPTNQSTLPGLQSFFSTIHRSELLPGQKPDNLTFMGDAYQTRTISEVAVATLQDGRLIMISVSPVGMIWIWDLMQGLLLAEFPLFDIYSAGFYKVAIGEWGEIPLGAVGTRNGQVLVWDLNSGAILWNERAHFNAVQALLIGQLSGEPVVVSGGDDGIVRVCWLNRLRDIVIDIGYSVHALALAPPDILVIAGKGGLLTLQIPMPTTSVSRTLIPGGFLYAAEINGKKSIAHFTRIIESAILSSELLTWVLLNRGLLHAQQENRDQALVDYNRIISMSNTPGGTLALALLNRGFLFAQQKNSDQALADYNRVIELPGTPMALLASTWLNRGRIYVQQGNTDQAVADFSYVLELPGASVETTAWALFNRGIIFAQRGDTERALADYTQAIELPGAPVESVNWVLLNRPVQPVAWSLLNRGGLYAKQGNQERALADFTRAIELPGVPVDLLARSLDRRGFIYLQQGKRDEALADYSRVIGLAGASVEPLAGSLTSRGAINAQRGDTERAFADYTRVIELTDAPVEPLAGSLNNRGAIYAQRGDTEQALADYTRVIELTGAPIESLAGSLLNRGLLYAKQGNQERALADFTRAIELPGVPVDLLARSLDRRGFIYLQQGKRVEALADYSRVIGLAGAPVEPLAWASVHRGVIHAQRGDIERALVDYSRVIELTGIPVEPLARASLNRGAIYAQRGDTEQALADYTRVIELTGAPIESLAGSLLNRGLLYAKQGNQERALADFTRAIELTGVPVELLARSLDKRGLIYARQGRRDKALADYSRVIELTGVPVEPLARASLNRGVIYTQRGDTERALADFSRVIERTGAPIEVLAQSLDSRGTIYVQQGKPDEALADYTRVLELGGAPVASVAQAALNRGTIYVQQGKRDEAVADYTRVIELAAAPQAIVAWASLYRGSICDQQGKSGEALADYTRVLELGGAPVAPVAQAALLRGAIYVQQGKPAEALADYTRAIELPGVSQASVAWALFHRGIISAERGDSERAFADYTRVLELGGAPVAPVAQAALKRGFIHAQQRKLDKALADFTRAIELPGASAGLAIQALVAHGITKGFEGHIYAMLISLTSGLAIAGSNDSLRISVAIEMIKTIFASAYASRSEELLRQVVPFLSEKLPIREEQSLTTLLEIAKIGRTETWISVYDSFLRYTNDKTKKLLNQLQPMVEMLRRKELVALDRIPLTQRAIAQEILSALAANVH